MNWVDRLMSWYETGRVSGVRWLDAITRWVVITGTQAQADRWAAIVADADASYVETVEVAGDPDVAVEEVVDRALDGMPQLQ